MVTVLTRFFEIPLRIRESVFFFALSMFEKKARLKFVLVQILQLLLGILDLIGVAIIGLIGSLAITGISNKTTGNRVGAALEFLGLDKQTLQFQVSVLGTLAAIFLVGKTISSYLITGRTLQFLSHQSAVFSSKLVTAMLNRRLSSVQEQSIQGMIYTATGGSNSIMVGVVGGWFSLLSDIALLLILGGGLIIIDVKLTIFVALTYGFVALVLHKYMAQKLAKLGEIQASLSIGIAERISEIFLAYREVFVRNRRNFYAEAITRDTFKSASGNASFGLMTLTTKYVFEIALVVSSVAVAGYAFANNQVGTAVGLLSIFLASSMRIAPAIVRIQQGLAKIRLQTGYGKSTIELMRSLENLGSQNVDYPVFSRNHSGFKPEIGISELKFSFSPDSKWELEIPQMRIGEGEFVALVGASGAGKTTLVDLLLGLREPIEGRITISGLDPISAIQKWPGAIAYVPQDASVFPGTLKRNLCIGFSEKEIQEEYLWEALQIAKLDDFVKSLPGGLLSEVGERGTRLSGGQRQRLGIARAFISNPRLIVLDEATSSLDAEVEAAFTQTIQALKGRVTVVMIAHRLSTVLLADNLYFLKDGRLMGSGTFNELKSKVPDFARQASIMGL